MKKPNVPGPSPFWRALAELTIIVAGVLIALGAQSWWEQQGLDEDRANALASLRVDLDLAANELRDDRQRMDTTVTAILWILDPATNFDTAADSLVQHRLRYALWEISGAEIAIPTYEDLKGSGRLSLLSHDLREGLAFLEARLHTVTGSDDDNFQYQIRNLDPWLLDNAPLRDILRVDGIEPRGERMGPEVLRSRRVENMLLAKLELIRNLEVRVGELQGQIDRLRELIGS